MIRLIGYFFGIGAVFFLGVAGAVALYLGSVTKDLPDYEVLNSYAPPVTTRVHAGNGALMAEYARERRLYLPIQAIPDRVKAAFLSAEDKNFYQHPGVDVTGLFRAILVNVQNMGNAKVGDKTLIDTMVPALSAYREALAGGADFAQSLQAMSVAAEAGRDSTKNLQARIGRSARLGPRSIGVLDAGATSCCLILQSISKSLQHHLAGE